MRYKILEMINMGNGEPVSGQEICRKLGISRTAVWKHIKKLNEEGYYIESINGKGYFSAADNDVLNEYEIKKRLKSEIPVFFYDHVDSTNEIASRIAGETSHYLALVACSVQESGRGRMGRKFESSNEKGVWCSFVFKPKIEPEKAILATIAAAGAVAETINDLYGIQAGIKWPNDIIYRNKKVCGILSEMKCETNLIKYIIIGIGINVRQKKNDFSKETSSIAGSLKELTGIEQPRSEIISALCYNIQEILRDVVDGNTERILALWNKYNITDGKEIIIQKEGKEISAKAIGINKKGNLLVETSDGVLMKYNSGEISIRGIMNRN